MLIGLVFSLLLVGGVFSRWLNRGVEADADQQVLNQLREAGSNLVKPHDIEFFLYFPTEKSANAAALELRNEGVDVEVKPAADGSAWLCAATKRMLPEHGELSRLRITFNAIAKKFDGEYDGWGTGVVN